jgi:hypothetical protein
LAAIHDKADYLPTGDAKDFAHLYGKSGSGDVMVLRPAQYFERRRRA